MVKGLLDVPGIGSPSFRSSSVYGGATDSMKPLRRATCLTRCPGSCEGESPCADVASVGKEGYRQPIYEYESMGR